MANTYKNAKVDLTTTNATAILTVSSATTCVVKSILVSNDSSSEDTITLTITDSASAVFSLYKKKSNINFNFLIWIWNKFCSPVTFINTQILSLTNYSFIFIKIFFPFYLLF